MIHIVLIEPEIPFNTGAIGRSCVALGATLHLVGPLGFSLEEKQLRRAGLDYWQHLQYFVYPDIADFHRRHPNIQPYYATTKALHNYCDVRYREGDYLFFGKESAGLPEDWLLAAPDRCVRIPMFPEIRSLNLSNSVAIIAYEAYRQLGFPGLQEEGELHHHRWVEENSSCSEGKENRLFSDQ